jgi:hypothetical protein
MFGWIIILIVSVLLLFGAYCTLRFLATLNRDEFTDPKF